jgi:sugar lactone lactonase YvrE
MKRVSPIMKAHLIRGAFYLLLLMGVCLIPFALGQRNATERSAAALDRAEVERQSLPLAAYMRHGVARYNGTGNGYHEAEAVAVDNSGNVYVAGTSFGSGTLNDYATIKYNSVGQQQWVARYNGSDNADERLNAMTVDGSGNVYVTGRSGTNTSPYVCTTIKYDSGGHEQWVAGYQASNGGTISEAIAIDDSSNVYVAAFASNQPNTGFCATIKYNSAGEQQWVPEYHGGANVDEPLAIAVDKPGNVYVTGSTRVCPVDDYLTIS